MAAIHISYNQKALTTTASQWQRPTVLSKVKRRSSTGVNKAIRDGCRQRIYTIPRLLARLWCTPRHCTYLPKYPASFGETADAEKYERQSQTVVDAINRMLWMPEKGYYAMYRYGRDNLILNPRAETLGESLAILYGIADEERARTITASNPTTPFGSAIFFPQIADIPSYHNNALWPLGQFLLGNGQCQSRQTNKAHSKR